MSTDHTEAIENLLTLSGVPFKKKKVQEETPAKDAEEQPHEPEEGDERTDDSARPGSVEESFMGKKAKKK